MSNNDGWSFDEGTETSEYRANADNLSALRKLEGSKELSIYGKLVDADSSLDLEAPNAGKLFPIKPVHLWIKNGWGDKALKQVWRDLHFNESYVFDLQEKPAMADDGPVPVAVHGSINLEMIFPGLIIRPSLLFYPRQRDADPTYWLEEAGGAVNEDRESLSIDIDVDNGQLNLVQCSLKLITLLPFLDNKKDGGWERPKHLWIHCLGGDLRIESDSEQTEPYRDFAQGEGRIVDLSDAIPALPDRARLLLMLDASGKKTLKLMSTNTKLTATISIQEPALLLLLPSAGCDPSGLPEPGLSPAEDAYMSNESSLYLVSQAVLQRQAGQGEASVTVKDYTSGLSDSESGKALEFTLINSNLWRFFCPSKTNLVFPPEYAANHSKPSISKLRVNAPHLLITNEPKLTLSEDGLDLPQTSIGDIDGSLIPWPLVSMDMTGKSYLHREIGKTKEELPLAVLHYGYRGMVGTDQRAPLLSTLVVRNANTVTLPVVPEGKELEIKRLEQGLEPQTWLFRSGNAINVQPSLQLRHDSLELPPKGKIGWGDDTEPFMATPGGLLSARWVSGDNAWVRLPNWALLRVNQRDLNAAQDDTSLPPVSQISRWGEGKNGLRHFVLSENVVDGSIKLCLTIRDDESIIIGVKDSAVLRSNSHRIVVAKANAWPTQPSDRFLSIPLGDGEIQVKGLNRVFIEVQRVGCNFKLVTAMLGWEASEVFGMKTEQMHVTEYIYPDSTQKDIHTRTVEFNGACSKQPDNDASGFVYASQIYFWSSSWSEDSPHLRLACEHTLKESPSSDPVSFISLHDAEVVKGRLDYSSDIVVVPSASLDDVQQRGVEDPWRPSRRNLFTFSFVSSTGMEQALAFLSLRPAEQNSISVEPVVDEKFMPRILPTWEWAKQHLLTWFAPGGQALRGRSATRPWLPGHHLRTRVENQELSKHRKAALVYSKSLFKQKGPFIACTLSEPINNQTSNRLPRWVPSLISNREKITQANHGQVSASTNLDQIWIFDPRPRVLASRDEKQGNTSIEIAEVWAKRTLRVSGWRGEAVLESVSSSESAPDQPVWSVIDSPLLNINTDLSWFGWPLSPDGEVLKDDLPLTRQVKHVWDDAPRDHSVSVIFLDDTPEGESSRYSPILYRSLPKPVVTNQTDFVPVQFDSKGIRPNALHIVSSGDGETKVEMTPSDEPSDGILDRAGAELSWGKKLVSVQHIDVIENNQEIELKLALEDTTIPPEQNMTVTFTCAPDGLQLKIGDEWKTIELTEKYAAPSTEPLLVRLKDGQWSKISVIYGTPPFLSRSFFAEPQAALCGLFSGEQMIAFGEESVSYSCRKEDDQWKWNSIARLLWPHVEEERLSIVQVTADGKTTIYKESQ